MNSTIVKSIQVVVEKDSLLATIHAGKHTFLIDEPLEAGGSNQGPDPYEALLGALGACTAITLRMYAQNKGWPLARISIRLGHQKNYSLDCQNCEQPSSRLEVIEKVLLLEGDLSSMQLERLKNIADKCPVQKTLSSGLMIHSVLA
ncbi:OsmC family protein [Rhodocytophaga aerolata]|uniref:OsmC family protein n=1 Tax=Rhodocytophaga aerolata TaxID=455078 RepID=A0ABT8RCP3_9BACT|nr:OsmC family protein [Rhodocytophaga aerolata]MDO1449779.1 OsmC family protein [Rhodocytophaga aerolata]